MVFFLKFVGDRFIPDSSLAVDIQLERQKYLVDKHMRCGTRRIVACYAMLLSVFITAFPHLSTA